MRIAHFSDCEPGRVDGVSVSAGLAVRLLRSAGHRVSYHHPGPIRTVPVPGRLLRLAAPWLRVDPGELDVVHAHTTGPIGMAGFRLARRRGVPLVITWQTDLVAYGEHFRELLAAHPDATLVIVGVRQYRARIQRLIDELGLTDRVRLRPPVPRAELTGIYRSADVLAFASGTDTQSLVVGEAEALGLPVVVADPALGRPDGHRVTCAATPEAFGAALARMLDDPELRERTRRAGLGAAAGNTPEVFRAGLEQAYREALARHS